MSKISFYPFIISFLLIVSACGKNEGCMDPEALNYSMGDANCAYARDQFIGDYQVTVLSDPNELIHQSVFSFSITEDPMDKTRIWIKSIPMDEIGKHLTIVCRVQDDFLTVESIQFVPIVLFCGLHTSESTWEVSGSAKLIGSELDFSKFRLLIKDKENGQIVCQFDCAFSGHKI